MAQRSQAGEDAAATQTKRLTLRWLMLVPTLFTITVGLAVFGVYVDRVEYRSRIADVDEELVRAESNEIRTRGAESQPGPGGPPAGINIDPSADVADNVDSQLQAGVEPPVQLLVAPDGTVESAISGANPFDGDTINALLLQPGTSTAGDPTYRVRVSSGPAGLTSITALPLDQVNDARTDFRRALVVGGILVVAIEALIVWFVTTGLIRPVTRMSHTATRVADGALDTDVGPPSGSRETFDLAIDLDRMLVRLRSTLDERERSAEDARRARHDMQRFLADVSHELRTPLTALRGYSELYAKGMLDEPGALDRAMGRVGDESVRLNGLVSNLLDLAKDDASSGEDAAGGGCSHHEVFDAAGVVDDVVSDLRAAFGDRSIVLGVDPTSDHTMRGAAAEIHQAVLNLGSNACQHTDGAVSVNVLSTESHVTFEVVDHGAGIHPDVVDKMFLPFFRADPSRNKEFGGGAGLGLAVAKKIAEAHNGTIDVRNTRGGGATLVFSVPRCLDGLGGKDAASAERYE